MQVYVNISEETALMELAPLYDQQVYIAIWAQLSSGGRAEKDDFLWLGHFDNPADDFP
jgi:hypothetical protein